MNREKLLQAIEKVKPAILLTSLTNLKEQDNLMLFNTKEVKSYNDEILITAPIKTKINGAIPANELISLLQKMNDKKIKVNQEDKILEIIGESTKAKLKMSSTTFPKVDIPKKWKTLPKDFIEGIKHCRFSIAMEGNVLSNIYITKDKIISCDNYRITEYTMKSAFKKEQLIPFSSINALISFVPMVFSTDKAWLFFKNEDGAVLCIRKSTEKYPNIESILKSKTKGVKVKLPNKLKEGLQRAKILSGEDTQTGNRTINIVIKNKKVVCHGECDIGQIDETIDIDYKGKEISFDIVVDFLHDILGKTQIVLVGKSSLKFKTKNLQHIIQLMK